MLRLSACYRLAGERNRQSELSGASSAQLARQRILLCLEDIHIFRGRRRALARRRGNFARNISFSQRRRRSRIITVPPQRAPSIHRPFRRIIAKSAPGNLN